MDTDLLRRIPAAGTLLNRPPVQALVAAHGHGLVRHCLRLLLDELRAAAKAGSTPPAAEELERELTARVRRIAVPALRRVVNASGVLLHTGLGRSPLCDEAVAALTAAAGYSAVQASLGSGDRSLREERIERMLCELTGCEAATVVNNNAAATMLMLATLGGGREVVVSRGHLVEIGGSYRMPDVMAMSGCTLVEVGCTNRTHLRDYERAITPQTAALLHVHTSNYRIRGFAGTPGIAELAGLAKAKGVLALDDIGSGALVPLSTVGVEDEPLVAASIAAGAEIACFSGDKLIGGPQAGILVGSRAAITRLRANPYARMFRVCKLTLAALEATLVHYLNGTWREAIPFWAMASRPASEIAADAAALAARCADISGLRARVVETVAFVGSGSAPDEGIASAGLRLSAVGIEAGELARRLRTGEPSVFVRLEDGACIADCRTLRPGDAEQLLAALRRAMG
ncbi:MAG TPA: L-seryl-tRNA(Sec) selenium transferase [Planctomycetes bacterium]|nr:L-seryl-tRNA(Sec) selenium transferase [Planctomycetota bacterium]